MALEAVYNTLYSATTAVRNPFGIDFELHKGKVVIPIGSALNCLGYNDYLERVIGVARVAIGLLALAVSKERTERLIAAGHILRGVLEMMESFERELLIFDTIFTIYYLVVKLLDWKKPEATPPAPTPALTVTVK